MSNRITEDIVKRIHEVSKVEDFIPGLKKSGKDLIAKCPFCGREGKGKGMMVSPTKQIWKCWSSSCDRSGKGAVSFVQERDNLNYPEALRFVAKEYNIETDPPTKIEKPASKKKAGKKMKSFCDLQLESSGLTQEDVMVEVRENESTIVERPAFRAGTRSQYNDILPGEGDDMLIYYYDLEGKPVKYRKKDSNRHHDLIRVRWQNPMAHRDTKGEPIKYQSPAGSGSHIYIPEHIRKKYKNSRKIKTLFIQEGEKKAEKCCKHDIPSVGIMGINNIGSNNVFPEELQLIIQRCEVEEILFMLDSDWRDLSQNLKNGSYADKRPKNFFYAVKNYKEYMRELFNLNIKIEIYFGYIKPNKNNDKGIDDYLNGTLKGKEGEMSKDITRAMHDKEGNAAHVQVYKITTMSDSVLADLWYLNDADKFAKEHYARLKDIPEFYIKNIKRRFNEDGELEMDQPLLPDEQYWQFEKPGDKKSLQFDYANCYRFLQNRGYWRIMMRSGEFQFIHIENKVINIVDNYAIKDYVTGFTEELKERKDVLNMLYRGGTQYLGFEKLSNLKYYHPKFERADKTTQMLFFKEKIWQISGNEIKEINYTEMSGNVWKDKIINYDAKVTEPLLEAIPVNADNREDFPGYQVGEVYLALTQTGMKCDFLRFLLNASDFYWKKRKKGGDMTDEEEAVIAKHLLNKLTAIGYLLHDYKNDSELKAVIGMDGMLSEVGSSHGRTGKSLLGVALEHVIPQVYIAAKSKKLTEDNFLFGEVTEKTKNVFLDDVRANIDFEFFFPLITGKLKVNPKGGQPFTLGKDDTPKLLITTNHAINGDGSSFSDRQVFMAFSDYYNDNHKPVHDFGKNFFTEWDGEQWNLFYNLMANCLMLYFRSLKEGWSGHGQGVTPPPMDSLEKRRLRQQMGEDFLAWAEEYFSDEQTEDEMGSYAKLNRRNERKEMYDNLLDRNPQLRKYVTASSFAKRIKSFCKYNGFHYNPEKKNREGDDFYDWIKSHPGGTFFGEADKSGGKEYITISTNSHIYV